MPDALGTGGEFFIRGHATLVDAAELRARACEAAAYRPEDRYILFELEIDEAGCNGYGDVLLPEPQRWMVSHG